jgi:hypothetical protein
MALAQGMGVLAGLNERTGGLLTRMALAMQGNLTLQRTSCLVDEARPAFGVDVGTGGCACHGGGERVAWQCDGDAAAFDGVAGVGGSHGDLNGGRTDRDIDETGSLKSTSWRRPLAPRRMANMIPSTQ